MAACSLLFAVVCFCWLRSEWRADDFFWLRRPSPGDGLDFTYQYGKVRSDTGGVAIETGLGSYISSGEGPQPFYDSRPARRYPNSHGFDAVPGETDPFWYPLGFEFKHDDPFWRWVVPYWSLATLTGLWPVYRLARLIGYKRRRRLALGLCARCGYDLRASAGRCPECGAIPATPADVSQRPAD